MMRFASVVCCNVVSRAIALTSISLVGWASPGLAEDWIRILTNQMGNAYYVDTDSVQRNNDLRNFWSLVESRNPMTYQDNIVYHSASFYVTVDCRQNLYTVRRIRLMDESSTLLEEYTLNDPTFYEATPGSAEEASMRFVCSR